MISGLNFRGQRSLNETFRCPPFGPRCQGARGHPVRLPSLGPEPTIRARFKCRRLPCRLQAMTRTRRWDYGAMARRCEHRRVVARENIADERRHHGASALPVATPKCGDMGIQSPCTSIITRQRRACTNPAAAPRTHPAPARTARSMKAPSAATHRCLSTRCCRQRVCRSTSP